MAGARNFLLKASVPLQKLMQKIGNPEPLLTNKAVVEIVAYIQPGDVMLSRENWRLVNPLVPGFWGHAAIYAGRGRVIEAVTQGVREDDLLHWLYQKDSAAILRPKNVTKEEKDLAVEYARAEIGKPYDYSFAPGAKEFYCSELVSYAYNVATGNKLFFYPRETLGIKTVIPQDFWDHRELFDLVSHEINN